ncbi:MAG: hypothetical protein ABIY70_06165 [Capsulimonas sp.]|uniref:TolB family protein n=1 Tax=Capsulimonas sp. TaxID=2494211 RepID=UPI003267E86B
MHHPFARILATIILASTALPALAERDIVFAARHYAPPGSRQTTHFHLYRINPDGSRLTPLTSGAHDDAAPRWSPDGRWIAFTRDSNNLCVIRASGGPVYVLSSVNAKLRDSSDAYVDFNSARWLPDSRRMLMNVESAKTSQLLDVPSGRIRVLPSSITSPVFSTDGAHMVALAADGHTYVTDTKSLSLEKGVKIASDLQSPAWLTPTTIVGTISSEGDVSDSIAAFDTASGRKLWGGKLVYAKPTNDDLGNVYFGARKIPGDNQHIVVPVDASNSTVRPDNDYYRVETKTCKAKLWLPQSQFLVFSPSGRYITSSARDLSNYGPKRGDRQTTVWTTDLRVGASPTDTKPRLIVHGLVWVVGADWRK